MKEMRVWWMVAIRKEGVDDRNDSNISAGKKEKETSLVRGKGSIACKVLNRMARGLE